MLKRLITLIILFQTIIFAENTLTLISLNSTTSDYLDSGDDKYYEVLLESSGTITTYSNSNIDTVGYIFDEPGNQITYNDDGEKEYSDFIIEKDLDAGKYYIVVSGYDTSTVGNFDLIVNFTKNSIDPSDKVLGTTASLENVTKLYVATFNRAPDSAGLDYWVASSGLSLEDIATSFFDQPEAKEKYPSGSTNGNFINAIYSNLFNRIPDTAGFNYWKNELDTGRIAKSVFILAVVNGAQDTDSDILTNKTEVGLAFANASMTDTTAATSIMKDITADSTTVTAAINNLGIRDTNDYINGTLVRGGDIGDDSSNATLVSLSNDKVILTGYNDDDDYYKLNISYTGSTTSALYMVDNSESSNISIRFFYVNENGETQFIYPITSPSAAYGNVSNDTSVYDVYSTYDYYMIIKSTISASNYEVILGTPRAFIENLNKDKDYIGSNLVDGSDAGNTINEAPVLTLDNYSYISGFNQNDDYFGLFTSYNQGYATLTLSDYTADLSLSLYNSNGVFLKEATSLISGEKTITYPFNKATTYYIKVNRVGSSSSSYKVKISFSIDNYSNIPTEGVDATVDDYDYVNNILVDGGDAGDEISLANDIALVSNQANISGYCQNPDFYKVNPPSSGTITFSLSDLSDNIGLYVYNSEGALIKRLYERTSTTKTIPIVISNNKPLFISVTPLEDSNSRYKLSINTTTSILDYDYVDGYLSVNKDASDTITNAETISLNSKVIGYVQDDDYFEMSAVSNGTFFLSLDAYPNNVLVSLLDESGNKIKEDVTINGKLSSFSYDMNATNTYYLNVRPSNDSLASNYMFTQSFSIEIVERGKNDYINNIMISEGDAGDSVNDAIEVDLSSGYAIIEGYAEDNDYYTINVANKVSLYIAENSSIQAAKVRANGSTYQGINLGAEYSVSSFGDRVYFKIEPLDNTTPLPYFVKLTVQYPTENTPPSDSGTSGTVDSGSTGTSDSVDSVTGNYSSQGVIYSKSGNLEDGYITKRNIQIGNCTIDELIVHYRVSSFFGEPTVNGSFKWTAGTNTADDCLPYSTKIFLKITEPSGGNGYIILSPVVPKSGAGYGYNVTGSPNWNDHICGHYGTQKTTCLNESDAKYIHINGSITDFDIEY